MTDVRSAACIATKDRPASVARILGSLLGQTQRFDAVVVVDASASDATRDVCEGLASSFGDGVLWYERSRPGLPHQRVRAIERTREVGGISYLAFFDDDVVLEPTFMEVITGFMESAEGRVYGGVSGFDTRGWGGDFTRLERFYHRLKVFDGPLVPGRWLYCGVFLEFEALSAIGSPVHDCDFLPGPFNVWRLEVFDRFLPPSQIEGYALGEDKHLSLRVGTTYRLAVHRGARAEHLHAPGGRPRRVRLTFTFVRMSALLLRDCDPDPSVVRYAAFIGFTLIDCVVHLVWRLARGMFGDVGEVMASAAGAVSCVIAPPARTSDALIADR